MNKIFSILALISWIVCFTNELIYILKNNNSKNIFKNFKQNALQIVRLDKLFLIIIFIIYLRFNKDFITSLVFTVICLYFYINKLYEKTKKENIISLIKKHWHTIIIVIIISILPFMYYLVSKNIDATYVILLFYIFFSYFIVGLAKVIINKFKR